MNGFTDGTTERGGNFTEDGGVGFGVAFYEFVESAARFRPDFEIPR
jgi:hypothetical protein